MRYDKVVKLTSSCVQSTYNVQFHTIQQHNCHMSQYAFICTLHSQTLSTVQHSAFYPSWVAKNEYRLLGWVTITNGNVATTIHNLWFRLHSSDKGALTIATLYHDDSIINTFTLLSWWYIWRCNNLICSFSLILSQICRVDEIGCLSASCTPCCFISYCLQKKAQLCRHLENWR